MKIFNLLLGASLIAQLHALDSGQLAAVSQKFTQDSGDAQYAARMELNKLIDEATAPGQTQTAEVNKLLLEALASEQTPAEAKKYILRVLSRTATADNVEALNKVLTSGDPLLSEEARLTIECILSPESAAALATALNASKDSDERIGCLNSLAVQKATQAAPAVRNLILDSDPNVARAAVNALGRIGGSEATGILKTAYASDKTNAATKSEIERALLLSASSDPEAAALVFKSSSSEALRLAAFQALVAGELNEAKSALLADGLKSENDAIRQSALRQGLASGLPALQDGLAQGFGQLPADDRLIVLANIHHLKSAEAAEKIATTLIDSEDEAEKIAALTALGHFKTETAFKAVLAAIAARAPRVNQAAGSALGSMDFPEGEAILVAMLKGDSSEDKVLAVKAIGYRQIADANTLLFAIIGGADKAAAQEAMKSLYASASIDDLAKLCEVARSTEDADSKKRLAALCKKIAGRLKSDEANKLVEGL